MIVALIAAIVIGAVGGAAFDALLRGRDPKSRNVLLGGIVGAIVAVAIRRTMSTEGVLIDELTALAGALLVAFAARVRLSALIAQRRL